MKINVDFIYPIGSIYISTESTDPSVLFGGKWVQTAKSRAIVGAGSNIANTDDSWGTFAANASNFSAGSRVGEATHTLSINEMPKHTHRVYYYINSNLPGGVDHLIAYGSPNSQGLASFESSGWLGEKGEGQAHNNIMPIEVYYIWKRVS